MSKPGMEAGIRPGCNDIWKAAPKTGWEIHHRACQQAKPDGVALAKRLFDWELRSGFDVFFDAVTSYADVLGRKGVAEYRRLAEEHWQKIPALGPGQSDRDQYGNRFRITSIMRALAKQAGNI